MARLLSIAEYGVLAALFAIVYIFDVFKESIQTVITKYSSREKNTAKLNYLLRKSINRISLASLGAFLLYLIISIFLSPLLNISYPLLAITGLLILLSSLIPITRGIMLGRKRFKSLGINLLVESLLKLFLAILFVLLGFKIYGAIAATIIGILVALLFSLQSLKDITKSNISKVKTPGIYSYSIPVLFITSIIIIFYSLDVIIAKMVFSSEIAGYYALASILGKTIFWGTQPISRAMFPLSAEKKSKTTSKNLFINALIMLLGLIAIALIIFYFFPDLILSIFSGKNEISQASSILFLVAIAFSIQSIANLVILNKLSLGKTKGYLYFAFFILFEVLILYNLSSSLIEFSLAYILASLLLLLGSIILLRK